jgi:hypothetical protein
VLFRSAFQERYSEALFSNAFGVFVSVVVHKVLYLFKNRALFKSIAQFFQLVFKILV